MSQAQTAANQAQSIAKQALSRANAAYCPDFKPYVVGAYAGTGTADILVNLGFRPKFLVISAQMMNQANSVSDCLAVIDGFTSNAVAFTSTGFTVLQPLLSGEKNAPRLSARGILLGFRSCESG